MGRVAVVRDVVWDLPRRFAFVRAFSILLSVVVLSQYRAFVPGQPIDPEDSIYYACEIDGCKEESIPERDYDPDVLELCSIHQDKYMNRKVVGPRERD
jgi:hypothetical protein